MSNLGFVSTKKHLKVEHISAALAEINQRRFKNLFTISTDTKPGDKTGFWEVDFGLSPEKEKWVMGGFSVSLKTRGRLSFKPWGSQWAYWAYVVTQNELATKYNGTLSDEGISGRWKPDLNKHKTYLDWLKLLYSHIFDPDWQARVAANGGLITSPEEYWKQVLEENYYILPKYLQF